MTNWNIVRALFWATTVLLVCGIALWRGQRYERLGAAVILIGWLLTLAAIPFHFARTEWGILTIDALALLALVWIALRSERYWPIFAAGFQLLAVMTHVASSLDHSVDHWAYITAEIIWGYLLVIAVGYGAWTAKDNQPTAAGAAAPGPTRL